MPRLVRPCALSCHPQPPYGCVICCETLMLAFSCVYENLMLRDFFCVCEILRYEISCICENFMYVILCVVRISGRDFVHLWKSHVSYGISSIYGSLMLLSGFVCVMQTSCGDFVSL